MHQCQSNEVRDNNSIVAATLKRKRRRRRPRGNTPISVGPSLSNLDEGDWEFCFKPYRSPSSPNRSRSSPLSLIALLRQREVFGGRTLHSFQQGSIPPCQTKYSWNAQISRCCRKRIIKFTELGTSAATAVLGIDQTGSFLVALLATSASINQASTLSLQILCIKSPSCKVGHRATEILSIPLDISDSQGSYDYENSFLHLSPLHTAVRVWLATDGSIGICMYRDTSGLQMVPKIPAHFVLFSMRPSIESTATQIWRLNNIHVPSQLHQNINVSRDLNLLWRTYQVPFQAGCADRQLDKLWWLCDTVMEVPAHLFLIDKDDGFQLTWIHWRDWHVKQLPTRVVGKLWESKIDDSTKISRSTSTSLIVVPISSVDSGWERSPTFQKNHHHHLNQLTIGFHGFLSVKALLRSILSRRPKLVHPFFDRHSAWVPNYSYNLVGLFEAGRTIEILLLFSVGPSGKGCIGVFVEVDLFSSDYRETDFIRHFAYDTPPNCEYLALQRRHSRLMGDKLASKTTIDHGLLSTMYPHCETFDNVAVRRQEPVWSLSAGDLSIEIVYG